MENGICPHCKKSSITISRGIEVGNIFQLGDKYTRSMQMQYLDQNGEAHYPVMGCYGIGVGRLAASVCEAHHDAEVRACADRLYESLQSRGIEVICDDRNVSAGVMFSDADLLGVPVRVIISPRNLKENCCEITTRDKSLREMIPLEEAAGRIDSLVKKLLEECRGR